MHHLSGSMTPVRSPRSRGWFDDKGNVAVIMALCLVPLAALAGGAIDFQRLQTTVANIQDLSDAAALNTAGHGPKENTTAHLGVMRDAVRDRTAAKNVNIQGEWISEVDYEVRASGIVPTVMIHLLPTMDDELRFQVVSVARLADARYVYKAPRVATLDPEAGDYNRISAYCYTPPEAKQGRNEDDDEREKNNKKSGIRSGEIVIADNGGSTFKVTDETMPRCAEGSFLSYRLHNSRNVRTNKTKWDNNPGFTYDHYTNTEIDVSGKETYGGLDPDRPILETVLCKTAAECKPVSKGGVIPEGKGRTPQQAAQGCRPGWFMYYGWEDRPPPKLASGQKPPVAAPGCAWGAKNSTCTDSDYDDIRVVIECPRLEKASERKIRLVR